MTIYNTELPVKPVRLTAFLGQSLGLAALCCLIVMIFRVATTISFRVPHQFPTTGYEQEALFSLWKWGVGQPVYADVHQLPFAASYFNWLFYETYGTVIWTVLRFLHLDVAWLPTIARLITLAFGIGIGSVVYALLSPKNHWQVSLTPVQRLALAVLAAFNPVFSWWLITARPDVAACFFEMLAILFFLIFIPTQRRGHLLAVTLCCFAAWSFKQSVVAVFATMLLWLFLERRFGLLLGLVSFFFGLVAIIFVVHDQNYLYCSLLSQKYMGFSLMVGIHNFTKVCLKFPLFPTALLLVIFTNHFRPLGRAKDTANAEREHLLTLLLLVSTTLYGLAACKVGANDNYYFIPCVVAVLWLILVGYPTLSNAGWEYRVAQPIVISCCLLCLANVVVMAAGLGGWGSSLLHRMGFAGEVNQSRFDHRFRMLRETLAGIPGPAFVTDLYGNLPWIQAHPPYMVLACGYDYDRAAGIPFQNGGLGGLIAQQYFGVVAVPIDQMAKHETMENNYTIDGEKLTTYYRLGKQDEHFYYFFPRGTVKRF